MFTSTAFASDNPVWTIDYKTLNLPKHQNKFNPGFNIKFTTDVKILISFVQHRQQAKSATKDITEKSDSFFVVLLLSGENGELIKRVEWPVMSGSATALSTKIFPLPSGGFISIIDRLDYTAEYGKVATHLQTFDSSFNVIHTRVLETFERGEGLYDIIVPLSGKYIVLQQRQYDTRFAKIIEIIDSVTLETMEHLDQPDFGIVDIWKDRLLSISYDGNSESRFFEKKIGDSQWNVLGLTRWTNLHVLGLADSRRYANPRFIYNGAIVLRDIIEQPSATKIFLLMIESGKTSGPYFEGCISKPSWNTPIVACEKSKMSAFRKLLDLFAKRWIETFDLSTQQVLLMTKNSADIVDYEISPNGDRIIIMTQKKIELYNVNSKKNKKK